ncbi:branched-chain alpha-keto acid dehydrogenase subunit E2 [Sulfuricella sp. T08]|uniref:dihydrolipoyllysine-residue acetyltransferase n=1 Tax=Sulfuricella sp. T08 TaxID=1632857 RepID=UPI000617A157|nr:dihydrolipoyllysine-residue acetyltransferase [Sulfuricella sp. T08]GAO36959.1 branched-chain alpha-keto acid dehydrogenase subunit E2 [Sulfuricella sp. T08]
MPTIKEVRIPDIGNFDSIDVIEVLVKEGDIVKAEDALITLESEKATMDIPAPWSGKVTAVRTRVGEKVSEGSLILMMEVAEEGKAAAEKPATAAPQPAAPVATTAPAAIAPVKTVVPVAPAAPVAQAPHADIGENTKVHGSPSVRAFARELGVNLALVNGSGPKRRILKEDVQAFVKAELSRPRGGAAGGTGLSVLEMPQVDFAKFGAIEVRPLTKIKKVSGANLHRNWVTAPHVTQHEEADITELEAFRKAMSDEAQKQGVRLTLPAFLIKAMAAALKAHPNFNTSLSADGESLVFKQYIHIGMAVDTPDGLVVPVIRNADQKGVLDLARELMTISQKARDKKLTPGEMQGGSISISSLGGIGGSFFTPIINLPEVAVLGISRATMKPVWNGKEFVPRLMLPLSLSYDHRVIDGAQGARFITDLSQMLADVRRLLL